MTTTVEIKDIEAALIKYRAMQGNNAKTLSDFVSFLSFPTIERESFLQSLTLSPVVCDTIIRAQYVIR